MTGFADQIQQFAVKTEKRCNAVMPETSVLMQDSIKFGSALTGAPAMPVAPGEFENAGALRDSVTLSYPAPHTATIFTTEPFALDVEDNPRGHHFHSGGPHGWKLTRAAFGRIVSAVVRRLAGSR